MNFDELKSLRDKKQRAALGFYLAEGEHLVLELAKALVRRPALAAARILVSHEYLANGLPPGFPTQLPIEALNARQISQLSETRTPQGVMAVVPILPAAAPAAAERAIYLREIQDPGNLGTIFRTLAWFGGFRCLLSPDSVDPYNAKVVRASMGALYSLPFETDVTLEAIRQRYSRIALLDARGRSMACNEFRHFDCYMFGKEADGASADMFLHALNAVFSIPGSPLVESLNLATAVNMAAYELSRNQAVESQKS